MTDPIDHESDEQAPGRPPVAVTLGPQRPTMPIRVGGLTPALGEAPFAPGQKVFSGFRLVERIRQGARGEAWRATRPDGVVVVLKLIGTDRRDARSRLQSLGLMVPIRHPHLIGLFGPWSDRGWTAFGMDLAEGSLADRFDAARAAGRAGLDAAELCGLLAQAALGIDFMNEPRHPSTGPLPTALIHRDIKPHNLLMFGTTVRVGDFGMVQRFETGQGISPQADPNTREWPSTIYSAPEARRGQASLRSDQYSLAATYYHLRGGQIPALRIAPDQPPDLAMIPPPERPAVARALALDPAARWPSCVAFVAALRAATRPVVSIPLQPAPAPGVKLEPLPAPSPGFAITIKTLDGPATAQPAVQTSPPTVPPPQPAGLPVDPPAPAVPGPVPVLTVQIPTSPPPRAPAAILVTSPEPIAVVTSPAIRVQVPDPPPCAPSAPVAASPEPAVTISAPSMPVAADQADATPIAHAGRPRARWRVPVAAAALAAGVLLVAGRSNWRWMLPEDRAGMQPLAAARMVADAPVAPLDLARRDVPMAVPVPAVTAEAQPGPAAEPPRSEPDTAIVRRAVPAGPMPIPPADRAADGSRAAANAIPSMPQPSPIEPPPPAVAVVARAERPPATPLVIGPTPILTGGEIAGVLVAWADSRLDRLIVLGSAAAEAERAWALRLPPAATTPVPSPSPSPIEPSPHAVVIVAPAAGPPATDSGPVPTEVEVVNAFKAWADSRLDRLVALGDTAAEMGRAWALHLPPRPPAPTPPPAPRGPRTATIVVRMPAAKAELVVRGEVGRGNPDEWYGPTRVIHSPPISTAQDYLVGAFWTEPDGRPATRSQPLRVEPGRRYEVDLRSDKISIVEVPRPDEP